MKNPSANSTNPGPKSHMPADYSDIIHLPRPVSKNHPPMSRSARAAQFAPFAALTGHSELVAHDEATAETEFDPEYKIILDN